MKINPEIFNPENLQEADLPYIRIIVKLINEINNKNTPFFDMCYYIYHHPQEAEEFFHRLETELLCYPSETQTKICEMLYGHKPEKFAILL